MRLGRVATLLLAVALLVPSPAAASPFDVYGFSSRAMAMGGAQGAAARDHAAIFYNPANLTLRTNTHFGASVNVVFPAVNTDPTHPNPELTTEFPSRNVSMSLGFVFPLGGVLDYRISIGLAITVPLVGLTRLRAVDPARPYFYRYEALGDNLLIAPAVGFRFFDWLRAGVGVQILAALGADLQVTGDLVRRRVEERSLTVDLTGATAILAGLHATAGPVEIGFTYRDDLSLDYRIPVDFLLEDVGSIVLDVTGTTLYSPRQLNLGLAWSPIVRNDEPVLTLAFDTTWELWSSSPSPAANIRATIDDAELRPDEETVETLFAFQTAPFDLGAVNVLVPRVGVEWYATDIWTLRAGYFHRPTPIPDQTGLSNVLDTNANVVSMGVGATFADPWQIHEQPATIDLHVQWTHLSDRLTTKDPDRGASFDGRYLAGGSVWNIGIELRHDF